MRLLKELKILFLSLALITFVMTGCKEDSTDPNSGEPTTDKAAFEKIADEDSSLASFDDNYNEGDALGWFGKITSKIYPFRAGQKLTLTSRNIDYNIIGDTAYATLTKNFNGILYIAASYDSASVEPDTILNKTFTSTVKRNLIFVRTGNSNRPYQNWRLAAISLPDGGTTEHPNIDIQNISITLPGGTITVTDPLNYYLARGQGWWRQLPIVPKDTDIQVSVQVFSTSADTDFVTVTWGGRKQELTKAKRRFTMISSTPSGTGFIKVYSQTYSSKANAGFFHAVINAFPKSVVFDDQAAVESNTWGFPYFVRKN